MLLRINNACVPSCTECNLLDHVGWLVNQTKLLLKFVFEANVRTWSSLLQNNEEFVALVRRAYTKFFELIQHEGWRLRRRVQFGALHSFLLEHREATFKAEMQFASELKRDLRELIGDSDEIFAIGLLELVSALLADGLETVQGVGGAAAAGSLSAPSVLSVQNLLLGNLKFCKRISSQVYLSGIYEILEPDVLCQALRSTKHRLFRLPQPVRKKGEVYELERQETRDAVPVVLAVPSHMQDSREITMLLQSWCSANDDINGYVLVLEDHGGWTGFEELPSEKIFGVVPGHGLDSTLAFGLRSGCLHIVATSAFALRQQQQLFDEVSRHSCRLVAEQEATFRPARKLLDQCTATALEIAHQQLDDVSKLHGLYGEEDQARCDLAFRYCDQVSKLFLNFQQLCELNQAAGAAVENYSKLVCAREDGAAATSLQWFSADDLNPEDMPEDNPNLQRFLTTANSRIFGGDHIDRSPSGSPRVDRGALKGRSKSTVESPTSFPEQSSLSPTNSLPQGAGIGDKREDAPGATTPTRVMRSQSMRAPISPPWNTSDDIPENSELPNDNIDTAGHQNGGKGVKGEKGITSGTLQTLSDSTLAKQQSQAQQAQRRQQQSLDNSAAAPAKKQASSQQMADLEIDSMAPPSPKNDGEEDEMSPRKAGADALHAVLDALVAAGPMTQVDSASLNVLAANALAHASSAWRSNLHGVLSAHGWQVATDKNAVQTGQFGNNMLQHPARARLAQDLGVLIQAFLPGSAATYIVAPKSVCLLEPNSFCVLAPNKKTSTVAAAVTPRKGVSFKTAGIVVRAGVRMAHDRHSSGDACGTPRWSSVRADSHLLFAQTKAATQLPFTTDPLEQRDIKYRQEKVIGRVIESNADIKFEPQEQNAGGEGGQLQGVGNLQRLTTGGRDSNGVSELPKELAARFLRHDRITLFTTSHDYLQATVENCRYVKQLLQRISFQTDTTFHEIDTVEDYYSDIKSYFRCKSSPESSPEFLPQVYRHDNLHEVT